MADGEPRSDRVCFTLQVAPEQLEEYRRRHAQVWPEMRAALTRAGWGNYSLFLREDGLLVGYLETDDFAAAQQAMATEEVNARWQQEMATLFDGLGGGAPDQAMVPIPEIFHLD